jgi:N-acetylglucosaminyldiphosphoundecaprenol N-acetyl-beta-D-mannosaminyltransferase
MPNPTLQNPFENKPRLNAEPSTFPMTPTIPKTQAAKPLDTVPFYGVSLTLSPKGACVDFALERLASKQPTHIITMNPEILLYAKDDARYARILEKATLKLPDGIGIIWALKRKGIVAERNPGIEFCEALLDKANEQGLSVALIGGAPEVLEKTVQAFSQRWPNAKLAYARHGYFHSEEHETEVAVACHKTAPDIV